MMGLMLRNPGNEVVREKDQKYSAQMLMNCYVLNTVIQNIR